MGLGGAHLPPDLCLDTNDLDVAHLPELCLVISPESDHMKYSTPERHKKIIILKFEVLYIILSDLNHFEN
jgi:hypothetical protein